MLRGIGVSGGLGCLAGQDHRLDRCGIGRVRGLNQHPPRHLHGHIAFGHARGVHRTIGFAGPLATGQRQAGGLVPAGAEQQQAVHGLPVAPRRVRRRQNNRARIRGPGQCAGRECEVAGRDAREQAAVATPAAASTRESGYFLTVPVAAVLY